MELINTHTKTIMEECKERARAAGLRFADQTLEYIVTNRDMLELSPKYMIPTLYDYWVHDLEVMKEKGRYELYPANPYETVINTRPAISFYNDNNPDWLNVMIFYHVLAHIDFFQNNTFFRHTQDYDFTARALSDKRLIARLRSEHGHWVDYVIEFSRAIDNLVGYFDLLSQQLRAPAPRSARKLDYYFDVFLQQEKKLRTVEYMKEIDRYNACRQANGAIADEVFFAETVRRFPEFETLYGEFLSRKSRPRLDLPGFILEYSAVLKRPENAWMKSVLEVVRHTSMFFQPQIRTKIMNEGWASYWHETLFLQDERMRGHEVDFARVNAGVTAMPRVGLNPYALGLRLFRFIEERADKGGYSLEFERLHDRREREFFDRSDGNGRELLFALRENYSDFLFLNRFVDQDFIDRHRLFVVGRRLNEAEMMWEYYVKSRRADDYRAMLLSSLYHPPCIEVDPVRTSDIQIYLVHRFEGKPLVADLIPGTLLGIEYLWGGKVKLETTEAQVEKPAAEGQPPKVTLRRVLYTMENRKITKTVMGQT